MMKKEKVREPQYISSPLNTPMLNYKEYYMSAREKLVNSLVIFVAGGALGLVFYGGQFKDADGAMTMATIISSLITFALVGLLAIKIVLPIRVKSLKDKRRMQLTQQFRGLLEVLAVSLSSGMNMNDALIAAKEDLKNQYSADAYIVSEVQEMVDGMANNIPIEDMMQSLGERSQIDDIKSFSIVFSIAYRAGGNLKDIVRRTNDILSEKIGINQEIETTLTSNKTQFTAMLVVPVVIIIMMRTMSSSFAAGFASVVGVIAMTIAIGLFVAAYILAQKLMDIKG